MKTVAICVIGTNAYFVLALRFINRMFHLYRGKHRLKFYFFTERDPHPFLPDRCDISWLRRRHKSWVDATNSKFNSISSINEKHDYLFYFDADTNINTTMNDWFIGELVSGEHWGHVGHPYNKLPFDKKGKGRCNIPFEEGRQYTYRYGAFFGGTFYNVQKLCSVCKNLQDLDHSEGYEAGVNDESYLNYYFHNNANKTIKSRNMPLGISCKGGLDLGRRCDVAFTEIEQKIRTNKNKLFNILYGKYTEEKI